MLKYREAKGRFSYEKVTFNYFKCLGTAIGNCFIIARYYHPLTSILYRNLGASQDVAGGI